MVDVSQRRVRWGLGVSPEVLCEYAGTSIRGFYSDAEVMLRTQRVANERFLAHFGVAATSYHVATPAYIGAVALGAELVLRDAEPPMLANQGRVLLDRQQVLALRTPDPSLDRLLHRYIDMLPYFERELGHRVTMGAGQEGPVTVAVLLRGMAFLADVHDDPGCALALLSVATDTYIAYTRFVRGINGLEVGGVGLADDFAGMLSPAMWPEFVVPYWRRLYEALGPGPRTVHTELLHREHLQFLGALGIEQFDPGVDQYLTSEDIAATVAFPFVAYIWPVRDLLLGTPVSIRRQYEQDVAGGACEIVADVSSPGIPADNIRAFLDVARRYE